MNLETLEAVVISNGVPRLLNLLVAALYNRHLSGDYGVMSTYLAWSRALSDFLPAIEERKEAHLRGETAQ